ncbi:MAG: DUF4336 domain-containing protein [Alphaproteobacteria bacterium]|nr:DUF4336 domain-containing protein [Alphaproteobacteria bacterium]
MAEAYIPYSPLNVLKPVAPDIWIADGPEIAMDYLGLKLPFSTRMTVVRLANGDLFVHSPIAPDAGLMDQVAALGPVAHLIAPNSLHYWYVPDWKARFAGAVVHAVPGLAQKAKRPLAVDAVLGDVPPPGWQGEMDQVLIPGGLLTECDFFHHASRTVILTDLIENFEAARVKSPLLRWIMRVSHVTDPDGSAPYDMRMSFWRHRRQLRAGVARMLSWPAERVILAHGRWYDRDGAQQLARAFDWAMR